MLAEILTAIRAVSEIVKMAQSIMAFIKENKDEKWFQDSAELFNKLSKPTSVEEKRDAARRLRDLIGGL